MVRRSYSSGSIRQNSANSFLVRYYNNAGKQVSETVRGNRKDAERVLRQRRVALETGDFIGRKKLTVNTYLQDWLDSYARSNVTAKTEAGYRPNDKPLYRVHKRPTAPAIRGYVYPIDIRRYDRPEAKLYHRSPVTPNTS